MFLFYAMRDYNIILCILPTGKKTQAKKNTEGKGLGKYLFLYLKIWRDLWGEILIWNEERQLSCIGLIEYQKTSALAYGFKLWSLVLKKKRQEGTLICGCKSRKQLKDSIFLTLILYDRILFESNFLSHDFMLTSLQILEMLLINIVELIN